MRNPVTECIGFVPVKNKQCNSIPIESLVYMKPKFYLIGCFHMIVLRLNELFTCDLCSMFW